MLSILFFFFQAEDGIRDVAVTGVQTCALPICHGWRLACGDVDIRECDGPWFHRRRSNRHRDGTLTERAGIGSRPNSARAANRSEEHTSELQSRLHLVCRLLLEKKKHTAHLI